MKNSFLNIILSVAVVSVMFASCKKDPGEGRNSSIYGKIYAKDYNGSFTVLNDQYYSPDEDVYIIYGNDKSYSDRTRTGPDGTYEFKYLRTGKYTVYVYSKDSTLQTTSLIAKQMDVEISKKNEEFEVSDIVIFK